MRGDQHPGSPAFLKDGRKNQRQQKRGMKGNFKGIEKGGKLVLAKKKRGSGKKKKRKKWGREMKELTV